MTDVRLWTFAEYMIRDILDVDLVSTTYRTKTVEDDQPRRLRVFTGGTDSGADDSHAWAIAQARAVADLRHPHVLTVHDAGHHEGRLYVVSDDVSGRVLREYVTRHHPLRPPTVATLGRQLGEALDAIHAAGLVHGSINPHTIWIGRQAVPDAPFAYLTGFGAARLLDREVRNQGRAPASDDLAYIAPEQILHHRATPEADRYALACALYHLLTGMPPFRRGSVDALLQAHLSDTIDPPASVRADTSHALDSVFERALAKQSSQRYPSAHALIVDFERALRAESVARSADTAVAATAGRAEGGTPDNGSAATAPQPPARSAPDESAPTDVAGAPPDDAADEASADVAGARSPEVADEASGDAAGAQPDDAADEASAEVAGARSPEVADDASADVAGAPPPEVVDEASGEVPAAPTPDVAVSSPSGRTAAIPARGGAGEGAGGTPELVEADNRDIAPTARATRDMRTRSATLAVLTVALAAIVLAGAVALTRDGGAGTADADLAAPDAGAPAGADEAAQGSSRQEAQRADVDAVQPLWSTSLGSGAVRELVGSDEALFVNAGRAIGAVDSSSGEVLWTTRLADRVRQTAVVDGVAVAATAQDVVGYDVASGAVRWRLNGVDITPEALAAGAEEVFAATRYDWGISLSAIAPGDGTTRLLGGIAAPNDPDTGPLELAFDEGAGATGDRTLYALTFDGLHAFDPDAGIERWRAGVDPEGATAPPRLAERPWVRSLNASGGAVFLVGRDGRLCRFDGETGVAAWTSCPGVPGPPERSPTLDVRAGRVVVAGEDAVGAYDVTTGSPLWSRSYANGVEITVGASADETVVADDGGLLRALDPRSGQQQWRSGGLGTVTVLLADDDGVYVGDDDGGISRVARRALGGSDDR